MNPALADDETQLGAERTEEVTVVGVGSNGMGPHWVHTAQSCVVKGC